MIEEIASRIAGRGSRRVYGVPGGGPSLELADALETIGVEFVATHAEAASAIMAGTAGRLSGRAGVAVSIKGPGLANMLPGLAACSLEAWPVVSMSEAYHPTVGPERAHKRMDHHRLTRAVAKAHLYAEADSSLFTASAELAEEEVPGPVCLDLTGRVVNELPSSPPGIKRSVHDPDRALELIAGAKRPMVIAGTLAIRKDWSDELAELRVPVFSSAAAKGVVDENLPQAAGVFTGVGLELAPEHSLLPDCDLVVGLGLRSNEVLRTDLSGISAVNVDPLGGVASPGFEFAATVDSSNAGAVFEALTRKMWGLERIETAVSSLRRHLLAGSWLPARAYEVVESRFDGCVRLVVDTGDFCTIGEHVWKAQRPDWFLGSGQGRYMGVGIPTAIGAALEDPTVPTVVVVGDGGIGPLFAELRTAASRRLPLIVMLMSDGGFSSIRRRAIREGLTEEPLIMANPSWVGAAEGIDITSHRITDAHALGLALSDWTVEAGPIFFECPFDPDDYLSMVDRLR